MATRPSPPYSVPLSELESVHVATDEQVASQPELRWADPAPSVPLFPADGGGPDGDGD